MFYSQIISSIMCFVVNWVSGTNLELINKVVFGLFSFLRVVERAEHFAAVFGAESQPPRYLNGLTVRGRAKKMSIVFILLISHAIKTLQALSINNKENLSNKKHKYTAF